MWGLCNIAWMAKEEWSEMNTRRREREMEEQRRQAEANQRQGIR